MGSQIRFFAVDEDLQTLMQVAEDASLLAIPQYIEANEEGDIIEVVEEDWYGLGSNLPPKPPTGMKWNNSAYFLFCLFPSDIAPIDLVYRPLRSMETGQVLPGEQQLRLNERLAPVIQVWPSRRVEDKVYNGRIYLGMERDNPRYREVRKHYDRLVRRVRKWDRAEPYRLYVGPQTVQLQKEGHIRLILIAGDREVVVEE